MEIVYRLIPYLGFESLSLRSCREEGKRQGWVFFRPLIPPLECRLPLSRKLRPHVRLVLRSVTFGAALFCVYFGSAEAAFYAHQRSLNRSLADQPPLPLLPSPTRETRLLVFAPHPDDETLGSAGLIQKTRETGGTVKAVIFTNGDGFPAGVQHAARRLRLEPADYIRFGTLRQSESGTALHSLGVPADAAQFLGYPDGGLLALWNSNWTSAPPFASAFTRRTASPYRDCFHPGTVYTGQNVTEDVKRAIAEFRPTLITVTHPEEDHSDHAAAAAFVQLALAELQDDPASSAWAKPIRLLHYLVHRGDWPPKPGGRGNEEALAPPPAMRGQDTQWNRLLLTPAQSEHKAKAISLYASQTVMMERFLSGFVTANEIYGQIRASSVPWVPNGTLPAKASPGDWNRIPPALVDPVEDNLVRSMQGGADVKAVYVCHDLSTLYLRVDTRTELSSRARFYVVLRPFGFKGESPGSALGFTVQNRRPFPLLGIQTAVSGNTLELALPLSRLTVLLNGAPLGRLALSVDTSVAGVGIDRTGIRLLEWGR